MWSSSKDRKYFDYIIWNQGLEAPNLSFLKFYYFFNSNLFTRSFYPPLPYDRKWSLTKLLFEYNYSMFFKVYVRIDRYGYLLRLPKLLNGLNDRFRYYWMVLLGRRWSLVSQIVKKHFIWVMLIKLRIVLNMLIKIYRFLYWFLFHSIFFISSGN